MISKFTTDSKALRIMAQIIDRADSVRQSVGHGAFDADERCSLLMDLSACHRSCPLKLTELLHAPQTSFVHDVFGIWRNINRSTGKLDNHFVPRYARD